MSTITVLQTRVNFNNRVFVYGAFHSFALMTPHRFKIQMKQRLRLFRLLKKARPKDVALKINIFDIIH